MKIKYKIAILFSITCTVIIALTGFFLYVFFANNIEKQFQERLLERAVIAAQVLLERDEFSANKYEDIKTRYLQTLPGEKVFYLRTIDGTLSFENVPLDFINKSAIENSINNNFTFYKINEYQVCSLYYVDNEGNYVILLAAKNEEGASQLAFLQNTLWGIVLTGIILIAAVSLFFAKHILRPIKNMNVQVEEISGSNLQLRLDEGKGKDEISRLAQNFNGMLSRIETSFSVQKSFIRNASHELRTPLTIILGEAEYSLKDPNQSEQNILALKKIYQQANHLKQLLHSLLHLSEIQNDQPTSNFELVRVDEIIQKVIIQQNETITAEKITMEYCNPETLSAESFEVTGNKLWLEIAFTNLLNNATKYSAGKPVKVSLSLTTLNSNDTIKIIIEDQGIGIPSKDQKNIFTPFYRATNAQPGEGFGIGLSLTQNIIHLHKGKITLHSRENKGSKVIIEFPV